MTDLRTAAQQALDEWHTDPGSVRMASLMMNLGNALAEPVQEPVAWMHTNGVGHVYFRKKPQDKVFNPRPVYLKDE